MLVRLLARLADVDVAQPKQSLSDRLSQWLGWTDAIALSAALNGSPPAVTGATSALRSAEEDLGARVRQSLTKAIGDDGTFAAAAQRGGAMQASSQEPETDASVEYGVFRQRYLSMQQAMETDIGNLRGRLRAMLAARSPAMAQLASVDVVMERALGARERSLLVSVPGLLGAYFERLRRAEQQQALANAHASGGAAPVTPNAWLNVFRKDMKSVLLAELDIRFQPVEGLLAALRSS
jgi:Protein of unknown function (DUF3348)